MSLADWMLTTDQGRTFALVVVNLLITLTVFVKTCTVPKKLDSNKSTLDSVHGKVNGKFDELARRVDRMERRYEGNSGSRYSDRRGRHAGRSGGERGGDNGPVQWDRGSVDDQH